jgi:hypothetical protein
MPRSWQTVKRFLRPLTTYQGLRRPLLDRNRWKWNRKSPGSGSLAISSIVVDIVN